MSITTVSGANFISPGLLQSPGMRAPLPGTTPVAVDAPGASAESAGLHIPTIDIMVEVQASDTIIVGSVLRFNLNSALVDLTGDTAKLPAARLVTAGLGCCVALEASAGVNQLIKARVQGLVQADLAGTVASNANVTVGATAGHFTTCAAGDGVYAIAISGGTDTVSTCLVFPFPIGTVPA